MNWIILGFAVYAVTLIITESHIMKWPRRIFRMIFTPFFWRYEEEYFDDPEEDDDGNAPYDYITCAMCVGVLVTLAMSLIFYGQVTVLEGIAAYGMSYFLKTQELP